MKRMLTQLCFFLFTQLPSRAQHPVQVPAMKVLPAEKSNPDNIQYRFTDANTMVVELPDKQYDRLMIVDPRGNVVLKKPADQPVLRIDLSHLDEGVYLLVLRSGQSMKEQNIKFVLRR